MSKVELYLVKSSSGSYDDYREYNELVIYATLEAANKRKQEIIDDNVEKPFPFDWCTEEEFNELTYEGKATNEDLDLYDKWCDDNYSAREFQSAWVQTLELDLQSWREKQLSGVIG